MRMPNEFTRILQVGMMLVLPVGLASCAPEDGEEMETPEETTLPDTGVTGAVEPVTVDINEVEDSEVEGEATISRVGESLMVSLQLENLTGAGPFRAQILSGRCEDRPEMGQAPAPGTTGTTTDTAAPATTGTPGAMQQGQVLATLEPIQVSGAAGQPGAGQPTTGEGQAGMSHSTIPASDMQAVQQAFIEVHGEGARTIACGNIDNLSRLISADAGATGGATMTPPAGGTTPGGTPGSRP
jgi:hypothetical protein